LVSGSTYRITDASRRVISPNATLTVLDAAAAVPAGKYTVYFGSGKIEFTNGYTVVGAITVTGSFLTLSQLPQSFGWTLDMEINTEETQTFGDAWKERTLTTRSATATIERFYHDDFFPATNLGSYVILALYIDVAGADRFVFAAHVTSISETAEENSLLKENVGFTAHGGVDLLLT